MPFLWMIDFTFKRDNMAFWFSFSMLTSVKDKLQAVDNYIPTVVDPLK